MKRLFPVMAWAAVTSSLLAVVMGGVVRVTGSGLGCPDWPFCHGHIIPPWALSAWLEYLHRLSAAVAGIFTFLMVITAFYRYGLRDRSMFLILLAPGLLLIQVILGRNTVLSELRPEVALVHTGIAASFVGLLAVVVAGTTPRFHWVAGMVRSHGIGRYRKLTAVLALSTFLLILSGAYVTRSGASLACLEVPLCETPVGQMVKLQWIHMAHRGMALLVGVLALALLWQAWSLKSRRLLVATGFLVGLLALQLGLGIGNVLLLLPAWVRGAHLAIGALFFAGVMFLVGCLRRGAPEEDTAGSRRESEALARTSGPLVKSYLELTKPRIVLLLLISTAAGMLAAGGGSVLWGKGVALLVGGFLCAGGAGAMNCYLDRDVDTMMVRTRHRPLPLGRVTPRSVFIFSVVISLLSIPLFLVVSPLITILAVVAWLYYVFVYSMYLKRRTTQNIVIGGAAGAFPPLIGWTAVTGSIDLAAVFLFLIVFFWTPPHAWALMLALKEDYRRVGIPMLPAVRGDRETVRQILLYGTALLGITVLPALLGLFGLLYLASAVLLGTFLIALSVRLYWSPEPLWALRLFRYSTLYLGLLFLALVLDRILMA